MQVLGVHELKDVLKGAPVVTSITGEVIQPPPEALVVAGWVRDRRRYLRADPNILVGLGSAAPLCHGLASDSVECKGPNQVSAKEAHRGNEREDREGQEPHERDC